MVNDTANDLTLLGVFLIPLSVFLFYKVFNLGVENQTEGSTPRFKIDVVAHANGPRYYVYRAVTLVSWSLQPCYIAYTLKDAEDWIARAKSVKEKTLYR